MLPSGNMDSDANSTPIGWIRTSGGLEKTRVIVDPTSQDPCLSEHIKRRETIVRVTYGQKTARAALKIGKAFEELGGRTEPQDTGEENIRREDTGLAMGLVASNDNIMGGNALDLVSPNSAAASSSGSASNVLAASTIVDFANSSSSTAKRQAAVDLPGDNLPIPKKRRIPKKRQ
jgi:hypothetical protein